MSMGDVYNCADLARQMDVSEGMLALMMEDLARKGYLAPLATAAEGGCSGCGGCGRYQACAHCSPEEKTVSKGWVLTAKGREAAERRRQ